MGYQFNVFTGQLDIVGGSTNTSWKAPVANAAALPGSGNTSGDVRIASDTGIAWEWNGSSWTNLVINGISPVTATEIGYVSGVTSALQTQLNATEKTANKGVVNGYASLDSSGHIPLSQLPPSLVEYQGTWDASTNTPTLSNSSGVSNISGYFFIVSTGGTVNFGAGNITFNAGDWVLFNGTIWEQAVQATVVQSVNGQVGVVTVNAINQLSGDVTTSAASGSQSEVATIQSNVVSNTKLSQMSANTVKANITGSTANASDVALGTVTEATSSILTLTGWTDSTIGSPTIQVKQSSTSQSGYLSSTDWTTFNNKAAPGNAFVYPISTSTYGGTNSTLSFSGGQNTVIGPTAGGSLTTAVANTLLGFAAGSNITGGNNTVIGANSGGFSTGTGNTIVGSSSTVSATQIDCVVVGSASSAGTTKSTVVGWTAAASGSFNHLFGTQGTLSGSYSIGAGWGVQDTGANYSIILGQASPSSSAHTGCFVVGMTSNGGSLGASPTTTAANQIVFGTAATSGGSLSVALSDMFLGKGAVGDGVAVNTSIQPTPIKAGNSDKAGGNLTIRGGNSTGTGAGGSIIFQTASAAGSTANTQNTLRTVASFDSLGNHNLFGSSSGEISITTQAAAGTYNFNLPTTAGTATQVLTSQGGGSSAMTWSTVSTNTSPNDISPTSFSASNNISSAANVTGLSFSNASVGSFEALVQVLVNATTPLRQTFNIQGTQIGAGGWEMSQTTSGDESGFTFTINSLGQILYTNNNYTGFVSATVKFRALTLTL